MDQEHTDSVVKIQNVDSLSTMMEGKAAIPVSAKARASVSDEHEWSTSLSQRKSQGGFYFCKSFENISL